METVLIVVLILCFLYIFKWVHEADIHYKWFYSLKPGDMIQVQICSDDCECYVEAMVTSEANAKYIKAEISTDLKKQCENCFKGNNSCQYNVNYFHRSSVNKLPE